MLLLIANCFYQEGGLMMKDKNTNIENIDLKNTDTDIKQNGSEPDLNRPDQTYWSLVKRQYGKNKLAVVALYLVIFLVVLALLADVLANNKPVVCTYKGNFYAPVFKQFLVDLSISKWDAELLNADWKALEYDFVIWPPVKFYFSDVDLFNNMTGPSVETGHYLGTDGIGGMCFGLNTRFKDIAFRWICSGGYCNVHRACFSSMSGFYGGQGGYYHHEIC